MNKSFKMLLGPRLDSVPAKCCVAICLFTQGFAFPASAGDLDGDASSRSNLTVFFRQAISSPPEIECFVASQRILRQRGPSNRPMDTSMSSELPPPMFYEGAWSGMNFFLRCTATVPPFGVQRETTGGRAGSNSYHINENTLVQTSETMASNPKNPIAAGADADYGTISQFFNMGIGGTRCENVVWDGNEFKAILKGARVPFYGRLEISNGLPFELKLSRERGGKLYKKCTYVYPNPRDSLSGFPARTVIWALYSDGLDRFLELTLMKVQIAKTPIPEEAFRATRFVTTNTLYTTIYSNDSSYTTTFSNGSSFSVGPNGQMTKTGSPAKRSIMSMLRHRTIVLIGIGLLSGIALLLLLLWRNWDEQN